MRHSILSSYSIIAPAGSGKSTVARILHNCFIARGFSCELIKLAEPLYRLQGEFYETAAKKIHYYQQNHQLLETIADQLRLINKHAIIDNFINRYNKSKANIIINDDLRDDKIDWPVLSKLGFKILYVKASPKIRSKRLRRRNDIQVSIKSKLDKAIAGIKPDYIIDNESDSIEDLTRKINAYVDNDLAKISFSQRRKYL